MNKLLIIWSLRDPRGLKERQRRSNLLVMNPGPAGRLLRCTRGDMYNRRSRRLQLVDQRLDVLGTQRDIFFQVFYFCPDHRRHVLTFFAG